MLVDFLPSIIALTAIQILGVMSPGPDFAVVVRNSLIHSRKVGILTAIGLSLGIFVHLTYVILGFGILISKTVWLFHLFKYLGAGYLVYIGIKGILTKKHSTEFEVTSKGQATYSTFSIIREGFLVNVLNPKAMLFFLSLISAFITPAEPTIIVVIYGAIIFFSTLIWFSFVAICFSSNHLRSFFKNYQYLIERITGCALVLLGIKMLFAESH